MLRPSMRFQRRRPVVPALVLPPFVPPTWYPRLLAGSRWLRGANRRRSASKNLRRAQHHCEQLKRPSAETDQDYGTLSETECAVSTTSQPRWREHSGSCVGYTIYNSFLHALLRRFWKAGALTSGDVYQHVISALMAPGPPPSTPRSPRLPAARSTIPTSPPMCATARRTTCPHPHRSSHFWIYDEFLVRHGHRSTARYRAPPVGGAPHLILELFVRNFACHTVAACPQSNSSRNVVIPRAERGPGLAEVPWRGCEADPGSFDGISRTTRAIREPALPPRLSAHPPAILVSNRRNVFPARSIGRCRRRLLTER